MKRTLTFVLSITLIVLLVLSITACGSAYASELWHNAKYSDDTTLGNGSKTVEVEVKAADRSVTFTIKTDKDTLAEAMLEHGLIAGEEGQYGLYVKEVNGIKADADADGYYWGLYKNGEMTATGADGVNISNGEHYELVREK